MPAALADMIANGFQGPSGVTRRLPRESARTYAIQTRPDDIGLVCVMSRPGRDGGLSDVAITWRPSHEEYLA